MSDPKTAPPDPVRALENTKRTLAKLLANLDEAIAAAKEPANSR